nr:PREDICTED: POU domain, class 6, transcription factor 1 isoform X2 [Bemisia tabaci]
MAEELSKTGEDMLATVTASIHKPVLSPGQPHLLKSEESDEDSCSSSRSSSISGADSVSMGVAHTDSPCAKIKLPPQLLGENKHINSNLLAGIANNVSATNLQSPLINTPLNLSINANGSTGADTNQGMTPQLLATPQPAAMPQFILASGQLVQGIQGAQLLIPTAQGIATQTILTIPVNHVTSNQVVNLALSNGQVITTTLANLQSMAQPHHLISPQTNGVSPSPPSAVPPSVHPVINFHQSSHNGSNTTPTPLRNPPQNHFMQAKCEKISNTMNNNNNNSINSNLNSNFPSSHALNSSSGTVTSSSSPSSRLSSKSSDLTISTATTTTTTTSSSVVSAPNHYSNVNSPTHDLFGETNQPTISQSTANTVDGINLDEIKEFAKAFKLRRLSLGLTQTQVGQALSVTEGPAYSQSAICRFEKLDITPKSAEKIKPVLERWLKEAEERHRSGQNHLTEFIGMEPSKKRKRRTSFTPQALELLNAHFELNTHPSGTDITALAHQLGYEREVIRIWFCNKRQALKNTVRMMSKGCT